MGALISADDLVARLASGGLDVLDTRSGQDGAGRAAFEAGHIPGARHTDYAADGWRAKRDGAPGMLPDADHLGRLIGRIGLDPARPVVIVPAGQNVSDFAAAARIYWTLRHVGYRPVAILDGGHPAWVAAGLPMEQGPPPEGVAPAPLGPASAYRAVVEDVETAIRSRSTTLLDARAPSYFQGKEKAPEARVAGHLPGALNIDYVTAYDAATNRLKSMPELEALFAGVPRGAPLISYCNTGHTAALNWFVLSELMGMQVRLYDGSMTEWTQDPSRPVA